MTHSFTLSLSPSLPLSLSASLPLCLSPSLHSDVLLEMQSVLQLSTNMSKQPIATGGVDQSTVIDGLDGLPREPAHISWSLRRPSTKQSDGDRESARRRLEQLFDSSAFVSAPLFADAPLSPRSCKADRKSAYKLLRCVLQPEQSVIDPETDDEERINCIHELASMAQDCPRFENIHQRLGYQLTLRTCLGHFGETPNTCRAAMQTLASIGSVSAQASLARFVRELPLNNWQHDHVTTFLSISKPSAELLSTFAERLSSTGDGKDGLMLLTAAHLASQSPLDLTSLELKSDSFIEDPAALQAARIIQEVQARLAGGLEDELRVWAPLHNHTSFVAKQLWDEMAHDARNGWIGHHAQMDEKAHAWEHKNSPTYQKHVDFARDAFEHAHLQLYPGYSKDAEKAHHSRIINALRAMHNLGLSAHAPLICEWLEHRNDMIVVEAVEALSKHASHPIVEDRLLDLIRHHLLSPPSSFHWKPRVLRHALDHFATTERQNHSEAVTSEAVKQILRLPNYKGHDHPHAKGSHTKACIAVCRSGCNPHVEVACQKSCTAPCQEEAMVAELLKKIVSKGKDKHGHDVRKHLRRHYREAHASHHGAAKKFRDEGKHHGREPARREFREEYEKREARRRLREKKESARSDVSAGVPPAWVPLVVALGIEPRSRPHDLRSHLLRFVGGDQEADQGKRRQLTTLLAVGNSGAGVDVSLNVDADVSVDLDLEQLFSNPTAPSVQVGKVSVTGELRITGSTGLSMTVEGEIDTNAGFATIKMHNDGDCA